MVKTVNLITHKNDPSACCEKTGVGGGQSGSRTLGRLIAVVQVRGQGYIGQVTAVGEVDKV